MVVASVVSAPAGTASPLARSVAAIADGSTFAAAILARSGVSTTVCARAPVTVASRTPSISSSLGTTARTDRLHRAGEVAPALEPTEAHHGKLRWRSAGSR